MTGNTHAVGPRQRSPVSTPPARFLSEDPCPSADMDLQRVLTETGEPERSQLLERNRNCLELLADVDDAICRPTNDFKDANALPFPRCAAGRALCLDGGFVRNRSRVSVVTLDTRDDSSMRDSFLPRPWPNVIGVVWVLAAAAAMMAPTLRHGWSFGSFDLLSNSGLTSRSGVRLHNTVLGDQIDEMIPWGTLAWTQVHHGQIPLWNPYSALGMPLAFNWQSAAFAPPTLISYLVPLRLAYTVQVLVTLVIAERGLTSWACSASRCNCMRIDWNGV